MTARSRPSTASFRLGGTLRNLLVSLCFGYVNVSGDVPLQRVAAGLSTHVFLFCLLNGCPG
jgi:hypothetical protein